MPPLEFLFICKLRHSYGGYHDHTFSSGLYQSALFVSDMLNANGISSMVVQVVDNNAINTAVTKLKPKRVFIEALWVVPDKFAQLIPLHPKVKWYIRVHSNTPFIAQEGIATEWLSQYLDFGPTMNINCNGREMFDSLNFYLGARYSCVNDNQGHPVNVHKRVTFLPNYYPVSATPPHHPGHGKIVNVGCFGAVRILKDQLIQAIAAIDFAEDIGRNLHFHINASRVEGGNQVLKNLRNLFKFQPRHQLIEHHWLPYNDFIALIKRMDLFMQVSFSETFNICAADAANWLVPSVVSDQIPWANGLFVTSTTESKDIVHKLKWVWHNQKFHIAQLNKDSLAAYAAKSQNEWLDFTANS